ncbi:hypothetical protein EVAR_77424_1 [Eumeta japonica]|uniref:Uncharacterized protein n=1 Tax=Eumeta variegata TaxID=151549 RepID=A0A4C1UYN7_EUMVA|nr:hypothetical protein EVAR_77424_1 [Eumeta japonica]
MIHGRRRGRGVRVLAADGAGDRSEAPPSVGGAVSSGCLLRFQVSTATRHDGYLPRRYDIGDLGITRVGCGDGLQKETDLRSAAAVPARAGAAALPAHRHAHPLLVPPSPPPPRIWIPTRHKIC